LVRSPSPKPVCKLTLEALECRLTPSIDYVGALYHKFLGREPDAAGNQYWWGAINSGTTPQQVAAAIGASGEAHGQTLQKLYQNILGRWADPSAAWAWNTLQNGSSANDLETVLFGSEEYYQSVGGNNSDWLNQLYEQRLGRPIDQDGLAYWE